jgi:hypothetical protein
LEYRRNSTPSASDNFDLVELDLTDEHRQIRLLQPSGPMGRNIKHFSDRRF